MNRIPFNPPVLLTIFWGLWFAHAGQGLAADCSKGEELYWNNYLLAGWAMTPPDAKGSHIDEIEKSMEKFCLDNECPIFCSTEKSKVPRELLELQKKCRDKDPASCQKFFSAIGITDGSNPIQACFFLGGRACDFCDYSGGVFCKPGLRHGEPIHDATSALTHKIACTSGYQEACDGFKKFQETKQKQHRRDCSLRKNKTACVYVAVELFKQSKTEAGIDKILDYCNTGPVETCLESIGRGLAELPVEKRGDTTTHLQKKLAKACSTTKNRISCYANADLIKISDPEESRNIRRDLCLSAKSGGSTLEHSVCRDTLTQSIKEKKWRNAEKAVRILCDYYLNTAQNRSPALCKATRNELRKARSGKGRNL